jgi:hypothetical protein
MRKTFLWGSETAKQKARDTTRILPSIWTRAMLGDGKAEPFAHGAASTEDPDAEAASAAAAVAAAEAALKAAKLRAASAAAKARSAKVSKTRATKSASASPPDKRQHHEVASAHVRRPRAPEPSLLLQQPPGMDARFNAAGNQVKRLSPPKKAKASTSRGRSGRTPREHTGRTPRESHHALREGAAGPSNLGDAENHEKLFLTLTPRSTDTTTSTKTTASWREREQNLAGLSNTTGTNWWEAPPPQQHKRLVFPGEGIYAGVVAGPKVREGYGKMWFVDGLVYEGQWAQNQMQGNGKMTYDTGAFYDGDFHHGVRHGTGTLTYGNSDVYSGGWAEDNKEGHGTFVFNSDGGAKYEGQWVAGVMDGQGTYTFADGCKYVGGYQDGRRHGKGIFVREDGTEENGEWSHGRRIDGLAKASIGGATLAGPAGAGAARGAKQRKAKTSRARTAASPTAGGSSSREKPAEWKSTSFGTRGV